MIDDAVVRPMAVTLFITKTHKYKVNPKTNFIDLIALRFIYYWYHCYHQYSHQAMTGMCLGFLISARNRYIDSQRGTSSIKHQSRGKDVSRKSTYIYI